MDGAAMLESVVQSAKVHLFSTYSMTLKAARRHSNRASYGVDRHQDIAADIVVRRFRVLHDNKVGKNPYKWTRNSSVWTSEQSPVSPEDPQRKNAASSVSRTRCCGSGDNGTPKSVERVCRFWMSGNCLKGEKCRFLHSWCLCPGLGMLAALEGHKKDIKGISLPVGSEKLFSASSDGTLRVWDCHTGQCVHLINLGPEAGSLISEGPWVFIGMPNAVKAFNIQTAKEFNLEGPVGQVNAMAVGNEMLFAGASDGVISVWKGSSESDPFKYIASLKGHGDAVVCFIVGAQRLYSGSVDQTVKVWDLNSLQCAMTLRQHSGTVTSLLCWDQYLLSCSLDRTIKVWATSESGKLEVIYTHREEHSVRALCGMNDAEAKPILFCSCDNGTVCIYDLPSFVERGRIFSTHTVGAIAVGPGGLVFAGDTRGKLTVWNLTGKAS